MAHHALPEYMGDDGTREVLVLVGPAYPTAADQFCIWWPGAKGGWRYRNEWAVMTAVQDYDGKQPPMAGEWVDFPR